MGPFGVPRARTLQRNYEKNCREVRGDPKGVPRCQKPKVFGVNLNYRKYSDGGLGQWTYPRESRYPIAKNMYDLFTEWWELWKFSGKRVGGTLPKF